MATVETDIPWCLHMQRGVHEKPALSWENAGYVVYEPNTTYSITLSRGRAQYWYRMPDDQAKLLADARTGLFGTLGTQLLTYFEQYARPAVTTDAEPCR